MSGTEARNETGPRIDYPTDHVVGIVDTPEQLASLHATLTSKGFLDSEISTLCGETAARAFKENTGRRGLAHLAIRIAERIGIQNIEMEVKGSYERALQDGRFVVSVLTPTEERKAIAAQFIRQHGGHDLNFLGRLVIEPLDR